MGASKTERPDGRGPATTDARLALLVEGVREYAIFLLDPQGYVSTWNLGAERIKGYAAHEIIGQHFSRFYPADAVARGWPAHELEVARREGRFEDEGWRVRKDGGLFWANVVITTIYGGDGEVIGFSKITRDLTERREAEQALRESEERFRLLVEGVRDHAIFMLDPEGRVTTWNNGAERIKGYAAHEIIGQHFSRFYPADVVARGWPEHELAVARREGSFEDEGWRLRKDGSRFWANVVITALRDQQGRLRGFAKVTRDLTLRRQVEALGEAGRRMNEFLAMLGHELRNPLAPIRNAVAILRAGEAGGSASSWAHDVIERQVGQMSRIVDDLLDVSRITAGKIAVDRQPVDLAALVTRVAETSRALFAGKEQHLEVKVPAGALTVRGDATRLSQVLMNLLSNAHKYTPAGGHVRVALERDGRFAQLRVSDDGLGIKPELLPHVFDLFVQGERSLDRAEGGLGIGLTLVRDLVELQGGTVTASSRGPGHGSDFTVRLAAVAGGAAEAEPTAQAPAGASLRALVVDDNADSLESLAALLGVWGHQVRTAADGHAALAAAAEYAPDVILLDIGLPGLDGYVVAERLRDSAAVLVALTGYGQPEDAERARRAGFSHHLVKPVDPGQLRRLLSTIARSARP
jgi:PAS domain S-box-containing protein